MIVYFINKDDGSIASKIAIDDSEADAYAGMPGYTFRPPPACQPGHSPIFVNGSWFCAVDHRGTVWHHPGQVESFVIARLGEVPQPGWVPGPASAPPPPPAYMAARRAAYPAVTEQLDMLWHAMNQDPTKRLEPFYSAVAAVKSAYPTDDSAVPGSAVVYQAG